MKKERLEEIKNSYKEKPKPSKDYIDELARLQFDFIGLDIDMDYYKKHFKELTISNRFTERQFANYKSAVFLMLMNDFGYSVPKCESEFGYFMLHYGLKVKGDD